MKKVKATVRMETYSKNIEAIERFKRLAEQHCSEPLMDSLKTVPKRSVAGEEIENSSDEGDQDITSEQ